MRGVRGSGNWELSRRLTEGWVKVMAAYLHMINKDLNFLKKEELFSISLSL